MKKIILTFVTLLVVSCSNAQKSPIFYKKLDLFCFSLHKDLAKLDTETLVNPKFYKNKDINKKCKAFIEQNKDEIKEYQNYILGLFSDNVIPLDFERYEKQKNHKKLYEIYELEVIQSPFYELLIINPLGLIDFLFMKSVQMNEEEMSRFMMTSRLGGVLFYTKKINENQWEIFTNSYHFICKYKYDITRKQPISSMEIWKRKNTLGNKENHNG